MPLRLTLELVPRGIENHRRTVGILEIENTADHPDHPTKANYKFRMTGPIDGGSVGLWHQGILKDIDRDRGYWAHVKEVLSQLDCESKPMSIG
jgi:hypothetical protein